MDAPWYFFIRYSVIVFAWGMLVLVACRKIFPAIIHHVSFTGVPYESRREFRNAGSITFAAFLVGSVYRDNAYVQWYVDTSIPSQIAVSDPITR
jgi:hypothetical protein